MVLTGSMLARLSAVLEAEALGIPRKYMVKMWRHVLDRAAVDMSGGPGQKERDSIPYLPVQPEDLGLPLGLDSELLDVGCLGGHGLFDICWRRTAAGLPVPCMIGMDTDEMSLSLAEKLSAVWDDSARVKFIHASSDNLPFEDGRFQVVVAKLLLPYVRMEPTLGEMSRVTKAGGVAVLQVQSPWYYLGRAVHTIVQPKKLFYFLRVLLAGGYFGVTGRQPTNSRFSEVAMGRAGLNRLCRPHGLVPVRDVGNREKPMVMFRKGNAPQ